MPTLSTVWASGLIAQCIAQAQLLFTNLMTALGGMPFLLGAAAIFFACRFLLGPLVGVAVNAQASDTYSKFRKPVGPSSGEAHHVPPKRWS